MPWKGEDGRKEERMRKKERGKCCYVYTKSYNAESKTTRKQKTEEINKLPMVER